VIASLSAAPGCGSLELAREQEAHATQVSAMKSARRRIGCTSFDMICLFY
jgi:hypothetical protein